MLARSSVVPVLKSAALAFAVTFVMGQSRTLQATGPQEAAAASASNAATELAAPEADQLQTGESRVDDLQVQSELVADPAQPSRWLVSMTVTNPTDHQITSRCVLALERYSGNPMARVAPAPAVVWKHNEEIEVIAQGTITRQIALPKAIGDAITKTRKAADAAAAKGVMLPRFVSYEVSAYPEPVKAPRGKAAAPAAAQKAPVPNAAPAQLARPVSNPRPLSKLSMVDLAY